jgi:hypothetical protein
VTGSGSFLTLQSAPGFLPQRSDVLDRNQKVNASEKRPTHLPTHTRIFGI